MAHKISDGDLIAGLTKELELAIQDAVIRVQAKAHKDLQQGIRQAIEKVGLKLDTKVNSQLYDKIMVHVNFSVPRMELMAAHLGGI